jgi:hypothetical protein
MAGGDRITTNRQSATVLSSTGQNNNARFVAEPLYEGYVEDAILDNQNNQQAPDGYNVGSIKVRIFTTTNGLNSSLLDWAHPMESTIQEIPVYGELVTLHKIRGSFFYSRKVPIGRRIQENGMLNLGKVLANKASTANPITSKKETTAEGHKFGKYFKPDSRVRPLKHFEGDVLFQGRMGHSIRFGSSKSDLTSEGLAPNIILRAGQGKDIENTAASSKEVFGYILEDINKDASSIWMTSDQVLNFRPSTQDAGSHHRSALTAPILYDGAQIVANSDRIILNAKKTHILMYASEGIHMHSISDATIDTDSNILLTANLNVSFKSNMNINNTADEDFIVNAGSDILFMSLDKNSTIANKIYMGSAANDREPMVGGYNLSIFLARLINVLMGEPSRGLVPQSITAALGAPYNPAFTSAPVVPGSSTVAHVITAMGPGVLSPAITAGLAQLASELFFPNVGARIPLSYSGAPFNSQDNFVMISNEQPTIVKNEFDDGDIIKTENNKWNLTDSYYKIL